MKRTKGLTFILLIALNSVLCINFASFPEAHAMEGTAKVYIVRLPNVDGCVFENTTYDPTETMNGAIEAATFNDKAELPLAHPKLGKLPPFYSISYMLVQSWSIYKSIIENEDLTGVIIVNTHGEIFPVPQGYTREQWIDKIAEAMLNRRITWVHTAGYPFFFSWQQGATGKAEWGMEGFRRFMSPISLNVTGVDCLPPGSLRTRIDLHVTARYHLKATWGFDDAFYVDRGYPLNGSVFKNYTIQPIWGVPDTYSTGAAIAYANSSQRFDPSTFYGFGAYVHIGTNATYNMQEQETDADWMRGYIGTAVAIFVETCSFEPSFTHEIHEYGDGTLTEIALIVAPRIVDYQHKDIEGHLHLEIGVTYGIYGIMKTNATDNIGSVHFELHNLPAGDKVTILENSSKDGVLSGAGRNLNGMYISGTLLIAGTVLFILNPLGAGVVALSELAGLIGGVGLAWKWISFFASDSGPETPTDYAFVEYEPEVHEQTVSGFTYHEFQTILYTEFKVSLDDREQWTIAPLDFLVEVGRSGGGLLTKGAGGLSFAIFNSYDPETFEVTAFFEDFEEVKIEDEGYAGSGLWWQKWDEWFAIDLNDVADYDFWGISNLSNSFSNKVWCAQVGTNSLENEEPNEEVGFYDKGMDAWLFLDLEKIDLRPYHGENVTLRFFIDHYNILQGDYMTVMYYDGANLRPTDINITGGSYYNVWKETQIPRNATEIDFVFHSRDDSNPGGAFPKAGVYIDNVEIKAKLPNDANEGVDAPEDLNDPLEISISTSLKNYAGYSNDADCYGFQITNTDIQNYKRINITLNCPTDTKFWVELYNNESQKVAEHSENIVYQLTAEDQPGEWKIKVYAKHGFGPYNFDMQLISPGIRTLTIIAYTGGTTNPAPGTHDYSYGESVQVTANAYPDYAFSRWKLDGAIKYGNPIEVSMTSDHTLKAYFSLVGGCPYVYTWNGSDYVLDNNVLGMSEVSNGTDVEDFYRLEQPMTPSYTGNHFSVYSLMLGEFENEHSYIDKVRLYAVDHDPNVNVAVTSDGETLTYSDPNTPISAVDNYGIDWLSSLLEPDDTYYRGFPSDYLLLDFGSLDVSEAAKLVLRANFEFKKDTCIHVQVLNETSEWTDAAVLRTRQHWSTLIVDLADYLPNPDGTLKIRLYFTGIHKIDYIGLDTTPQADITTIQTIAVRATHSTIGSVTLKLLLNDQRYAELAPGEQIQLKFILPNNTEETRTFIIYIEGHYETINN